MMDRRNFIASAALGVVALQVHPVLPEPKKRPPAPIPPDQKAPPISGTGLRGKMWLVDEGTGRRWETVWTGKGLEEYEAKASLIIGGPGPREEWRITGPFSLWNEYGKIATLPVLPDTFRAHFGDTVMFDIELTVVGGR